MSRRAATWLAWSLCLLVVLATAVSLVFRWMNDRSTLVISVFTMLVYMAFSTVGALIVSRRPQNAIGRIFIAGALLGAAGDLALEYAVYSLVTAPGTLAGGAWAAWFGVWARDIGFFLMITYVVVLFPDGRVPSPRWRLAAWLPLIAMSVFTISAALTPTPLDFRLPSVPNPLGIKISQGLDGLLSLIAILMLAASVIMGSAAAIIRFRRARGDERQQLKWFAYATTMGMCVTVGLLAATVLQLNKTYLIGGILFPLAIVGTPIATGIAILKYRLYAIDLLIRRTLVYTLLTGLLALAYFGSVLVLQGLVRLLTGQSQSQVVTVISTLIIAALFIPLRRRVQAFIDRRFYRSKYDAAQTLAAFSNSVWDEVELARLTEHLTEVVDETLQPETVSLWLRATRDEGQTR